MTSKRKPSLVWKDGFISRRLEIFGVKKPDSRVDVKKFVAEMKAKEEQVRLEKQNQEEALRKYKTHVINRIMCPAREWDKNNRTADMNVDPVNLASSNEDVEKETDLLIVNNIQVTAQLTPKIQHSFSIPVNFPCSPAKQRRLSESEKDHQQRAPRLPTYNVHSVPKEFNCFVRLNRLPTEKRVQEGVYQEGENNNNGVKIKTEGVEISVQRLVLTPMDGMDEEICIQISDDENELNSTPSLVARKDKGKWTIVSNNSTLIRLKKRVAENDDQLPPQKKSATEMETDSADNVERSPLRSTENIKDISIVCSIPLAVVGTITTQSIETPPLSPVPQEPLPPPPPIISPEINRILSSSKESLLNIKLEDIRIEEIVSGKAIEPSLPPLPSMPELTQAPPPPPPTPTPSETNRLRAESTESVVDIKVESRTEIADVTNIPLPPAPELTPAVVSPTMPAPEISRIPIVSPLGSFNIKIEAIITGDNRPPIPREGKENSHSILRELIQAPSAPPSLPTVQTKPPSAAPPAHRPPPRQLNNSNGHGQSAYPGRPQQPVPFVPIYEAITPPLQPQRPLIRVRNISSMMDMRTLNPSDPLRLTPHFQQFFGSHQSAHQLTPSPIGRGVVSQNVQPMNYSNQQPFHQYNSNMNQPMQQHQQYFNNQQQFQATINTQRQQYTPMPNHQNQFGGMQCNNQSTPPVAAALMNNPNHGYNNYGHPQNNTIHHFPQHQQQHNRVQCMQPSLPYPSPPYSGNGVVNGGGGFFNNGQQSYYNNNFQLTPNDYNC